VAETTNTHVKFLCDVACQKLSQSANVSQFFKNKSGTLFSDTVYISLLILLTHITKDKGTSMI